MKKVKLSIFSHAWDALKGLKQTALYMRHISGDPKDARKELIEISFDENNIQTILNLFFIAGFKSSQEILAF